MTTAPLHQASNPYAAPRSRTDDSPLGAAANAGFFSVSLLKLAIMYFATFGLYELYWFYRNWKSVQRLTSRKLSAPIRAFFFPLTSFGLFDHIRQEGAKAGVQVSIRPAPMAITVFVLNLLSLLPEPYWLLSVLGFLPLLQAQAAANAINRTIAPSADPNHRFSAWNIAWLAAVGLVSALAILGALAH